MINNDDSVQKYCKALRNWRLLNIKANAQTLRHNPCDSPYRHRCLKIHRMAAQNSSLDRILKEDLEI